MVKVNEFDPWCVFPATIHEIVDEAPGIRSYSISIQNETAGYSAEPGQFNMLYLPGVGEAAMSISKISGGREKIMHTVRTVGNLTRTLATLSAGASLGLRGPFGSHWPIESYPGRDLIIVAGGIGLAPLRPLVHTICDQRDRYGTVSLLIGTRTPADLLYEAEFASWMAAGIDVQLTVDRANQGWTGHIGVVTLLLQRLPISSLEQSVLFTCGPEVMMNYAIRTAVERGLKRTDILLSLERNMNCAIGHCGHCQFGPHFICKDGPVLRYDRVSHLLEVDSL